MVNQLRDVDNQDKLKEQILAQAVDYTEDTKHRIMADDLRHLIACAMQQMTVRQREVFRMSREEQMSHQEIADALGISINTVQEHISTSLRVLRVYLEKHKVLGADLILLLICLNL